MVITKDEKMGSEIREKRFIEAIKKIEKNGPIPRHYHVSQQIKDAIRLGYHKKGDRIPPERKLCEYFGVSRITIRRALDDLVKEGILEKVWSKGIYIKKSLTPSLKDIRKIGFTVWHGEEVSYHPATLEILRGIGDVLSRYRNYSLEMLFITPSIINNFGYNKQLGMDKLDGIIFTVQEIPDEHIKKLRVSIKNMICANRYNLSDSITIDFRSAGFEITEYLITLGHRKIALINGPENLPITDEVLAGYKDAIAKHSIKINHSFIKNGYYDYDNGFALMKKLLSQEDKPTAVIVGDDFMALGVIDALKNYGLECPEDISIISFNDFYFAKNTSPPLSTVKIPFYELGKELVKSLVDLIEGKVETIKGKVLKGQLVVRESTAPVGRTMRKKPVKA